MQEKPTELKQSSAVIKWMNTLKGAESFLDDAKDGKLPARTLTDGNQLSSVENMLKKTKEAVHREATRLHSLEAQKQKMPYGAKKVALLMGPGEENKKGGFQGLARRDARPGQVMREVTDLVDQYKEEEDAAAKELLREIASKIVESFDNHGLSAAQIAREVPADPPPLSSLSCALPANIASREPVNVVIKWCPAGHGWG
jgi:hypothetical protein